MNELNEYEIPTKCSKCEGKGYFVMADKLDLSIKIKVICYQCEGTGTVE